MSRRCHRALVDAEGVYESAMESAMESASELATGVIDQCVRSRSCTTFLTGGACGSSYFEGHGRGKTTVG